QCLAASASPTRISRSQRHLTAHAHPCAARRRVGRAAYNRVASSVADSIAILHAARFDTSLTRQRRSDLRWRVRLVSEFPAWIITEGEALEVLFRRCGCALVSPRMARRMGERQPLALAVRVKVIGWEKLARSCPEV